VSRRITIAATAIALVCSLRVLSAERTDDIPPACQLNVRSQPLDGALQEIARQCGIQILYFSDITAGKTAANLSGRYAIDDALHLLLSNTGLDFRHVNARTIQIQPSFPAVVATEAENESALDEVIIFGTAEGLVATRIETPLRDVPQSISVVSAEQMRLQNNFELNDVLEDVVGLTVTRQDSLFQLSHSRGFQINSYTLDGGGALRDFSHNLYGGVLLLPDLSEFDHVEVLRGANALFGADAEPGGAINLVRKRPLHDARLTLSSSGGSWDNLRQEVDVTGPLALDGDLRGRLGLSIAKHDYFFERAHDERKSVFGVVDYDLTPNTLLIIGGSYSKDRARPFEGGLPRLNSGVDPKLPRSTAYTFNWERFETTIGEGYARLEQTFGAVWRLKINATSLDHRNDYLLGNFSRPIDAATGGIPLRPVARYTIGPVRQRQLNLEATLTGAGQWGDHAVEMAFGGDFLRVDAESLVGQIGFNPPLANAYEFDPAVYPNPVTDPLGGRDVGKKITQILSGLFASVKFQATQRWSLTAGLRVSNEKVGDHSLFYFGDFAFPLNFDYEIKNHVTPFFGTVFTINENYSVYASYANIYRSNAGLVRSDESELSPSDGINMEFGVKGAWRDGAVNGSLAAFKIVDRGGAMFDPDIEPTVPECCYTADGRNVSEGADLELSGRPVPEWVIGAGYTFNQSEQVIPGDQIAHLLDQQTPKHLFKMWTNYTLPGGWSVGGSLHAQNAVHNDSRDCPVLSSTGFCRSGFQNFRKVQGSYVIVSPRVGYEFDEHWQVALSIDNLFDRHYYESIGTTNGSNWYGEPRSFLIRLDGRY
jgi:outer membrane receptor for ferric coprogen and ferric-rhodotorulic acid